MTALERYRAALAGEEVDHLPCHPITMMFASHLIGRPFRDYVMDHRVMVEGQLRMVEAFGVDYVATISDPCRETHDLGAHCTYLDDEAPSNEDRYALLKDKTLLASLQFPDLLGGGRMHDRIQAVAKLRAAVGPEMSVMGWVEGPIALAVDLRGMQDLMLDTVDDPSFVADLFEFCVNLEIEFARLQVQAGADSIGIGDAAASLISLRTYQSLVFPYEQRLAAAIKALGPTVRLHVCGNTTRLAPDFERLGLDLVDIDYLADLPTAAAALQKTAIMGNLEPARWLLRDTPDGVYRTLAQNHAVVGPRFVVGAGCEIPRGAPHDNVRAMVRYAREHGRRERAAG
jgi:MtaA/CmuA family methyltransferase